MSTKVGGGALPATEGTSDVGMSRDQDYKDYVGLGSNFIHDGSGGWILGVEEPVSRGAQLLFPNLT